MKQNVNYGGPGLLTLLTLLFVGLKLTGFIAWSWFWVLSPLIFNLFLILAIFFIAFLVVIYSKE